MLEVMVHRFESIHQEKSGSWMDVNQKAEKTSLGTLSGNWPEDEVMGRSWRQGGGGLAGRQGRGLAAGETVVIQQGHVCLFK